VELDVADVMAGKRTNRFHCRDRLSFTKAHLAPGQVCVLAAGVGEVDIAADIFTFHKRCLAGSNTGGPDGCTAQ
jgi:hypothetical protein